jgi:orotate phosphoribosyltransferase
LETGGTDIMYDRQRLIELFRRHALKFGDFTLASGRKSTYYLDGRLITLHAEGLWLIAEGILDALAEFDFAAVGGMSIGADPIVGGVLTVAAERGRPLLGFLVRKEAKEHGTKRMVEGPVQPGSKVVIVDDVITTGGSSLQAIDRVSEIGCQVVCAVGVCDRLQGGAEAFAARGIPFRSLLTIRDFGIEATGST